MCIMKWEVVENCVLVEIHKKTFYGLYLLMSSTKSPLFYEKILVAQDTHAKK